LAAALQQAFTPEILVVGPRGVRYTEVMAWEHTQFDQMDWAQGNHPLEHKKVSQGCLSVLQFEPGFSDPAWCERSHAMFVMEGTLHIEFDEETVAVGAGQSLWIDQGTRHRASVRGGPAAVVFIVSDVSRS
jgi:quercetin dioxygenase-like cupin family protein